MSGARDLQKGGLGRSRVSAHGLATGSIGESSPIRLLADAAAIRSLERERT